MNSKKIPCLLLASFTLGLFAIGCGNGDGSDDAATKAAMESRNAQRGGAPGGAPPKGGTPGMPASTAGK